MPTTPKYPGVYVEEVSSGVRTITGVATSVAAFVDFFPRGPMNQAVQVFSYSDFEREFGGLHPLSEASYGVQQFFLNGGSDAWIIRAASGSPVNASVKLAAAPKATHAVADAAALVVEAINQGLWGDALRAEVDWNTPVAGEFNLTVAEYAKSGSRTVVLRREVFRNLSMDATKPNYVQAVVNDPITGSKLCRVTASGSSAPAANGTLSAEHSADPGISAPTITVNNPDGTTVTLTLKLNVTIGTDAKLLTLTVVTDKPGVGLNPKVDLDKVAPLLQAAIRSAKPDKPQFAGATVEVVNQAGKQRLRVLAGPGAPMALVTFAEEATDKTATELMLTGAGSIPNCQEYLLGKGLGLMSAPTGVANTAQGHGAAGADGTPPNDTALVAALGGLEKVDLFNLLCIPRTALVSPAVTDTQLAPMNDGQAVTVMTVAINICEARRAMFLMDTPAGVKDYQAMQAWMAAHDTLRSRYASLYYPRIGVPDPLNNGRVKYIGASGAIAGLCSRIDTARGVWKAAAGTEAGLRGVMALEEKLTDQANGALNPLAINCIRTFPVYGTVVWGARTLDGADQATSEWKYMPVRRLANFLEETLFRATKWVVFEPNDEPLWAQVRLNIGAFMHDMFRKGAFQGKTPGEAYFVKCDKETTTQSDINQGLVNIMVGFAPLKPAEFVVLRFQQMAGKIEQ